MSDFYNDPFTDNGGSGGPDRNGAWEIPPEYAGRFERCIDGVVRDCDGNVLKRLVNGVTSWQILPPSPEKDPQDSRSPWLHEHETSERLEFARLADDPSITRQWAVPQWFPLLETVGLGGPGGEGKTLLTHMLATAHAHNWLGLPVEEMKSAVVLCEDRHDDAYLRQADINRHYGCRMVDLEGRLLVLPRRQKRHNYLGIFDADDVLHTTTYFDDLLAELTGFGARFTVLDTRADVFKGDQNNEQHARTFVRQVTDRIAERTNGYVMLLYQPSRAGKLDGSGESGSVQWDASFRGRGLLEAAKQDEDAGTRHLIRKKSNFSSKNEEIEIRWKDGVFWRAEEIEAGRPAYEIAAAMQKAERVFLRLLDKFNEQNRQVSSVSTSVNYAPKQFCAEPAAENCKQKELEAAMRQLFDANKIRNAPHGPPSAGRTKIVAVRL